MSHKNKPNQANLVWLFLTLIYHENWLSIVDQQAQWEWDVCNQVHLGWEGCLPHYTYSNNNTDDFEMREKNEINSLKNFWNIHCGIAGS